MRRITFSAPLTRRPPSCVPLLAALIWLAAADVQCQTVKPSSPPDSATPWSIPERFEPEPDALKDDGVEDVKKRWTLKCRIREIEELDRLYIEDAIDRSHYWIQLPNKVKIRAADPASFDGRKKLEVEDLAVGQRLLVTVRSKDDEILKLEVRPPAEPKKTKS